MYTYTLGFLITHDQILMVNREKKPWQGAWNGLGGKRHASEEPLTGLKREFLEETGIDISDFDIKDKGVLTWNTFDANGQGLHLFLIVPPEGFVYDTPRLTPEGILDWKSVSWIIDPANYGVAHNIPYFLPFMISDPNRYHYHCVFEGRHMTSITKELI